jgi:hypothetical protein
LPAKQPCLYFSYDPKKARLPAPFTASSFSEIKFLQLGRFAAALMHLPLRADNFFPSRRTI